jgi:hypothetical protein
LYPGCTENPGVAAPPFIRGSFIRPRSASPSIVHSARSRCAWGFTPSFAEILALIQARDGGLDIYQPGVRRVNPINNRGLL